MEVVESLIKGKDDVVRGANIRVISIGKSLLMSRPVQKLYPIEAQSEIQSEVPQGGALEGLGVTLDAPQWQMLDS